MPEQAKLTNEEIRSISIEEGYVDVSQKQTYEVIKAYNGLRVGQTITTHPRTGNILIKRGIVKGEVHKPKKG